jgi:hypothetical protein
VSTTLEQPFHVLLVTLLSTPPLSATLLLNVKPKLKQTQLISTTDTLDMLDMDLLDMVCHMPMELTVMVVSHMPMQVSMVDMLVHMLD